MAGFDALWPGGPRFRQEAHSFPMSTDSILLASFTERIRAEHIMDLGCGAGVLSVLLCSARPGARVEGVEIQPDCAALCRENLAENGFDPGGIVTGDLRLHRQLFHAGTYDLVVSNPPYFSGGSGLSAPDPRRAAARDERCCSLAELCRCAAFLCRWGACFALVHRPERMSELFCTLAANGLEPKRLRMVQHGPNTAPSLILVEARRGGKPGLRVQPPLVLTREDGSESDEAKKIYHRG